MCSIPKGFCACGRHLVFIQSKKMFNTVSEPLQFVSHQNEDLGWLRGLNYTHVNPLIPPCKLKWKRRNTVLICVAFGFSWSRICSPSHVVVAAIRCHTPEFSVRRKYILELTPVCGKKKMALFSEAQFCVMVMPGSLGFVSSVIAVFSEISTVHFPGRNTRFQFSLSAP